MSKSRNELKITAAWLGWSVEDEARAERAILDAVVQSTREALEAAEGERAAQLRRELQRLRAAELAVERRHTQAQRTGTASASRRPRAARRKRAARQASTATLDDSEPPSPRVAHVNDCMRPRASQVEVCR